MKHFLIPNLFWFGLLMSGGLLPGCSSSSSESAELSIPTDPATVVQGEELFVNNCSACHNFQQQAIGPALTGITAETEPTWLYHFIRNAPAMIDSGDARSVRLYEEYQQYMPPFTTLDSSAVLAIMGYLHTQQETPAAVTAATLDKRAHRPHSYQDQVLGTGSGAGTGGPGARHASRTAGGPH